MSVSGVAALLLVGAIVAAAAHRIVSRCFPWRGGADALLRLTVVGFAILVAVPMAIGAAGVVSFPAALAGFAVVAAGAFWWTKGRAAGRVAMADDLPLPDYLMAFGAALAGMAAAYGLIHSPLTAYDSLSYHLWFPARWLQDHGLSIIATPFSDGAQAYAPANGELYFLSLMLPMHGDYAARIGQVPFYLAIAVALYALARRLGASRAQAVWPAVLSLVSRPILEQAVGADVDLICWGLFLIALHLGFSAIDSGDRSDWVLWGVALGLYAGTKYVALVYAPVFVVFAIAGWRRVIWALPGIVLFGLPWYLRNWVIAGSPLYPASLTIAGITVARGAFSRAAMLHSVFHTTNVWLLPVMVAHAMGVTLLLAAAPFGLLGAVRLWLSGPRRSTAILLATPIVMTGLYWFLVPDNVDSRFMLPIALLGLVPLAFAFQSRALLTVYAAAVIWMLVGANAEIPATLPWFMGGWLSMRGLVTLPYVGLLLALSAVIWLALRFTPSGARPAAALGLATVVAIALGAAPSWCAASKCEYFQTTSIFVRQSFIDAWSWTDAHVAEATIANVGNNVPYPLTGAGLRNRVIYVNIDRHPTWRFHDYDRAARARRGTSGAQALATGSGVLLPLAGPDAEAVRPRYERLRGDRDAWVENLRLAGATHVFVSALSAYEIDFNWHNGGGFPIEDEWARADPQLFRLVYENSQVRIYALAAGRTS